MCNSICWNSTKGKLPWNSPAPSCIVCHLIIIHLPLADLISLLKTENFVTLCENDMDSPRMKDKTCTFVFCCR